MMGGVSDLISRLMQDDLVDKLRNYVDFFVRANNYAPTFRLEIKLNPSKYKGIMDEFLLDCKDSYDNVIWCSRKDSIKDLISHVENLCNERLVPKEIEVQGRKYVLKEE